jgi:hypothetical protein
MKRPFAYLTIARSNDEYDDIKQAKKYCRLAYEAGFTPICPCLMLPLFINNKIPEEHKSGIDISLNLLRRSHVLIVCGNYIDDTVKNDIAIAIRYNITATTLDGILSIKTRGKA